MNWLLAIEEMPRTDNGISGIKFSFLKLFHLTLMLSDHRGDHMSTGFGFGPLEVSVQFSIWYNKKGEK